MLQLVDYFDDVQLYVIADLIRPYQVNIESTMLDQSLMPIKTKDLQTLSAEKYQTNCCVGLRMKCAELYHEKRCNSICCKKLCNGTKERFLVKNHKTLKQEL